VNCKFANLHIVKKHSRSGAPCFRELTFVSSRTYVVSSRTYRFSLSKFANLQFRELTTCGTPSNKTRRTRPAQRDTLELQLALGCGPNEEILCLGADATCWSTKARRYRTHNEHTFHVPRSVPEAITGSISTSSLRSALPGHRLLLLARSALSPTLSKHRSVLHARSALSSTLSKHRSATSCQKPSKWLPNAVHLRVEINCHVVSRRFGSRSTDFFQPTHERQRVFGLRLDRTSMRIPR